MFIHVLTLSRLWNRTILSYSYSVLQHLSPLPPILTPHPVASTFHGHFELLLRTSVAADWIFGKESITVAHTWYAWGLVDRSTN